MDDLMYFVFLAVCVGVAGGLVKLCAVLMPVQTRSRP